MQQQVLAQQQDQEQTISQQQAQVLAGVPMADHRFFHLLLPLVLLSAAISTPVLLPPSVYYRFENVSNPEQDTMGTAPLHPTSASTIAVPTPTAHGGPVGSFLSFDGGNMSEVLAASAGVWNCSTGAGCGGITVEFLVRAGANFNRAGETAVLASRGTGSSFAFEALLARHGYGLHAGNTAYGFPQMLTAGEDVLVSLEGTGRASHSWLLDGDWHHVAMRKMGHPGNTTLCVVDVWIDGQVHSASDVQVERVGGCVCGGGAWACGMWMTKEVIVSLVRLAVLGREPAVYIE